MEWTEIAGALTGFLYVILEIKQKRAMWIVGALSAMLYMAVFFGSALYAAGALQIYYLVVSAYGWQKWGGSGGADLNREVTIRLAPQKAAFSAAVAGAGFLIICYILSEYADDPYPATDALVGSLSMLATYWVSGKHIENWLLWIVADIIAAVLFFSQELYATTALYVIYSVAAAAGYLHWRKFPRELK